MLLLTGGTGYIGQKMLPQLANSEQVLVLSRKFFNPQHDNVTCVVADLQDPQSLVGKFDQVTKVIHMASITHARDERLYWHINFEGTQNLLNALPKNIQQFVYTSTTCAAPNAGGYGESKLAVEKLLADHLESYCILQIADVYGGAGEKSLEQLITKVGKTPVFPLIGDGHYQMAPVHVDDVTRVIEKAVSLKGKHTFVVSGAERWSMAGLVQLIAQSKHTKVIPIMVPVFLLDGVIKILVQLGIGEFYPDQVKRFVVPKNIDSSLTWKKFNHQPQFFSAWLKSFLSTAQA